MQTKPSPLAPADRAMLAATQIQMTVEKNVRWARENDIPVERIPVLTDSDVLEAAEAWTTSRLDQDGSFRDYEGLRDVLFNWVMESDFPIAE